MQARNQDTQLAPVTRLGQRDMAYVELRIKGAIRHPVRMIELKGHGHQALGHGGQSQNAVVDVVDNLLEPQLAAGGGGLVVNAQPRYVHRGVGGLQVEEGGV